ncbi:hypothetical protein V6N13_072069 [Hibiscus sabdariffa]
MADLSLLDGDVTGMTIVGGSSLPSAMVNDRPPNPIPRVQYGPMLERSRSPSDVDLQDNCKMFREHDRGGFQ